MEFVIKGMKYNTEKMEKVAEVRKRYRVDTFLTRSMYPGKEVGRTYPCELWKSAKGNWLLTHEKDYSTKYGEDMQRTFTKKCLENCRKRKKKKRNPVARWGTKTTGLELTKSV